jgi:hypothetical protein
MSHPSYLTALSRLEADTSGASAKGGCVGFGIRSALLARSLSLSSMTLRRGKTLQDPCISRAYTRARAVKNFKATPKKLKAHYVRLDFTHGRRPLKGRLHSLKLTFRFSLL